ncbi:MAG TPA: MiaB/RimO family radical SAM methylthiotransferase [Phycisphaerae bacterium]|nr:MiaB/RimO family radical SAM methylthiotransferase [Phycisphaerae bacterium]
MSSKTVYLETVGCQMNALDSELVLGTLLAQGYQCTDDMFHASLVILNTCSVRQHAEDKVYSRLGQLRSARHRDPGRIVAVIGCMAENDAEGLLSRAPHANILCGPNDLHRLPGMIAEAQAGRSPVIALSGRLKERSTIGPHVKDDFHESGFVDLEALDSGRAFALSGHVATPKIFGPRQAYVRITRGCNKHCSFCVVPHTRGPEQHRAPDRIVAEVRRLADEGVVEVTLLGQTVNHYRYRGSDGSGETTFAQLLRRMHDEVPQLPRLRFVTSYPRDFTDDILQAMASCRRICRYLHLPAQSGSDAILRRMNRGYTVEAYKDLLARARALMPDICIAGDMIVGFSGETDEDFEQSLDLLRYANYKNCFVFKYSPRPGTPAAERYADDVPEEVKQRRNNRMLAVQAEINLANHREMIGRVVTVLVEGPSKTALKSQKDGLSRRSGSAEYDNAAAGRALLERGGTAGPAGKQLVGRTEGDQIVVLDGPMEWIGRFVDIRISAARPYTLVGQAVGVGASDRPATSRDVPLRVLKPQ